jgi:ABC-2 type transport system ATP-binding protein
MLQLTRLRKSFGAIVAVDDLDLTVERGETLGLLGPNGAGKSTTIKLALGIETPDSGTVDFAGLGAPSDPAVRRSLGYSPQDLAVYEELTARENLAFFGKLQGLRGAGLSSAVDRGLEIAGLHDRQSDRVAAFSGGMKRRLNIACATLHDPDLLLLDEPTVGVDPQSRNHIFAAIESLAAEGKTVIYTTHYMEEAERLCDRVAIVDSGRVLACDKVNTLLEQHGSRPVVAVELSAPPPRGSTLPGEIDGDVLRLTTDDPEETLADLRQRGVRWRSIHVQRADLETVFLELTGRRLRDA